MKDTCEREIFKGNLLKHIITRIDYNDIIKVSDETMKSIKSLFNDVEIITRMLNTGDFEFYDPIAVVDLPEEVIENSKCTALFFKDTEMIIEINQYFIRVMYNVDKNKYTRYENNILSKLIPIMKVLYKMENIQIKRVSIKKIDEVFFSSIAKMKKIFKSNILRLNLFDGKIEWDQPCTKLKTFNNFKYNDYYVNFVSVFERVQIDKIYKRLFLAYEVYDRNNLIIERIEEVLKELNFVCYQLFIKSLTPTGYKKLKNGESVGDYGDN